MAVGAAYYSVSRNHYETGSRIYRQTGIASPRPAGSFRMLAPRVNYGEVSRRSFQVENDPTLRANSPRPVPQGLRLLDLLPLLMRSCS
jgi:hypothetical protein